MDFEILGDISGVEVIAIGSSIRDLARIEKFYGLHRWRKLKGTALVRFLDGEVARAEVHRYEAHGAGRKELKIKRLLMG
jgi:hypothetical protein